MNLRGRSGRLWFASTLLLVAGWLAWSLSRVHIEFDDGYTVIANAQYFLGKSEEYFWQRGPLLSLLLVPAEWLAGALALHPLDTRAHHAMVALLHLGYLLGVWRLLVRQHGAGLATAAAFVAAILTPVFFSYAAFISQDILPGLLGLALVLGVVEFLERPRTSLLAWLVGLGVAVALFKQTFALFWIAALVAAAVGVGFERERRRESARRFLLLGLAATASGVLTWLCYAWSLSGSFVDTPWLLRPLVQTREFVANFQREGPIREIIWQWVYLRNLDAYGIAAMTLVLPAIGLACWRGERATRAVAIAWLAVFAGMHAIAFKEVRYLAMLAPMTAFLLVPLLQLLWRRRRPLAWLVAPLLAIDLARGASEAARLQHPFYREALANFFGDLPVEAPELPTLWVVRHLSFVTPERMAWFGDRYHRVINLNSDQIRLLYGYRRDQVRWVGDASELRAEDLREGARLLFANEVAARVPPLHADNRTTLTEGFVQLAGRVEAIRLRRGDAGYAAPDDALWFALPARSGDFPRLFVGAIAAADLRALLGREPGESVELRAIRVSALCRLQGCSVLAPTSVRSGQSAP